MNEPFRRFEAHKTDTRNNYNSINREGNIIKICKQKQNLKKSGQGTADHI